MSIRMSIERTMSCDNCGTIIASEDTLARLRKIAYSQCKAKRIDRGDYCADCVSRGFPRTSNAT